MSQRRVLLLMLVPVAAVCGAAVWLSRLSAPAPPERGPGMTAGATKRAPASSHLPAPPAEVEEQLDVEAARAALASGDRARVTKALWEIAMDPEAGGPLLEEVRAVAEEGEWVVRAHAKFATMRLEGSRRYLWDLVLARNQGLAKKIAPTWGPVLDAAYRHRHEIRDELPGFDELVETIESGTGDPLANLLREIERAGKEHLRKWLAILEAVRPLPAEAGPVLAMRLRTGSAADVDEIETWLGRTRIDLAPIAETVLAAALERLAAAELPELPRLLPAIAALGIADERVTAPLLEMARDPDPDHSAASRGALRALERLGPAAAAAAPELVQNYDRAPDWLREQYVATLGALGSPLALPVFAAAAQRTEAGSTRLVARIPAALVACDPKLETTLAPGLMRDLLRDERAAVRADAVRAAASLERLPDPVADTLLEAFRDDEPAVMARARVTLGAMVRGPADRPAFFLPVLVPLAETRAETTAEASRRSLAVLALGKVRPPSPEAVAAVRAAADSRHDNVRRAAQKALEDWGTR